MRQYRAQLLAGGPLGPMWCDVCGESKHAAFRLTPAPAQPESDPGTEETRALCEGCAEGLQDGVLITEANLEERRQRRRGSQEP